MAAARRRRTSSRRRRSTPGPTRPRRPTRRAATVSIRRRIWNAVRGPSSQIGAVATGHSRRSRVIRCTSRSRSTQRVDQDGRGVLVWGACHHGTVTSTRRPRQDPGHGPVGWERIGGAPPRGPDRSRAGRRPADAGARRRAGRGGPRSTCRGTGGPAAAKPAKGPRLTVDLKKGRHRISPLVYGANFAETGFAKDVDLPVDRWGGNSTETYNWQVRGSNHGQDWYFTNFADCWTDAFGYCQRGQDHSAADAQVQQDRATGTATLLTLPLMGWVANAVSYAGDHPCSYPAGIHDPQDDHDPYHAVCGNGRRNGQWLAADPTLAGVAGRAGVLGAVDRSAEGGSTATRSTAASRSTRSGNEPALWDDTHHAFHPQPTTYDELLDQVPRPRRHGQGRRPRARPRSARPSGAGPTTSARPPTTSTRAASRPRRTAPRTAAPSCRRGTSSSSPTYEQQTGRRLLDYFDLHYYPQGRYSPVTDASRPLFDTGYTDPSWIGAKIGLIPRMRAWVRDQLPGHQARDQRVQPRPRRHVRPAAAERDPGRRARHLRPRGPRPRDVLAEGGSPVPAAAFRIFRNYDGHHHGFGDRGVSARSSRPAPRLGLRRPGRQAGPAHDRRGQQGDHAAAYRGAAQARRHPRPPRRSSTPARGSASSARSGSATTRSGSASRRPR